MRLITTMVVNIGSIIGSYHQGVLVTVTAYGGRCFWCTAFMALSPALAIASGREHCGRPSCGEGYPCSARSSFCTARASALCAPGSAAPASALAVAVEPHRRHHGPVAGRDGIGRGYQ